MLGDWLYGAHAEASRSRACFHVSRATRTEHQQDCRPRRRRAGAGGADVSAATVCVGRDCNCFFWTILDVLPLRTSENQACSADSARPSPAYLSCVA